MEVWKSILYKYGLRLTGNRWDAEDVLQEAMIKLVEAVRKFPNRPVSNAFLFRVAKNTWIDFQRKQKLRTEPFPIGYETSEPDSLFSTRELLELLVERLSPQMAVIVLLMDVFDFTAKETSEYVQLKEAAVHVTLGRARLKLRESAKDPLSAYRSKSSKHDEIYPIDFDSLVSAFQMRDPEAIYNSYVGLARRGVRLAALKRHGSQLYFTFRDPDGNLFSMSSNEFF
jgi:RNA polymerase sigma-70 factor (ECF subfamily)